MKKFFSFFVIVTSWLIFMGNTYKHTAKIEYENGIKIIKNPNSPIFGNIKLDLKEGLCISSEEENYFYGENLAVDDKGNIYFLDIENLRVLVFSIEGKYLKTIGRKGDGPGEFQNPHDIYIDRNQNLIVVDERKIHIFDKEGNFQKAISIPFYALNAFIGKNSNILINSFLFSEEGRKIAIVVVNPETQITKTINEFLVAKPVAQEHQGKTVSLHLFHPYTPALYLAHLKDEKCVFGFSQDYTLYVVNQDLQTELIIKKDQKAFPIIQKEKDKIYKDSASYLEKKWPKSIIKKALQFPEHRPFFKGIISDDKGRIYVSRVDPVEQKDKTTKIDVFNEQGYFIFVTSLPFIPKIIRNGKVYNIEINEETGETKIKRYEITNWTLLEKVSF